MSLTREQIFRHLHALQVHEPGWEESRAALWAAGSEVVPLLIKVLEIEAKNSESDLLGYQKFMRLAELLAEFRHPQSLLPLLKLSTPLFRQVLGAVGRRAEPEDVQAILELMHRVRYRWWAGSTFTVACLPRDAVLIATTLVSIAERNPQPELRAALPLLKPHPMMPFGYFGLHKRLKAALANGSLPIPATAAQTMGDLPLLSSNEESA